VTRSSTTHVDEAGNVPLFARTHLELLLRLANERRDGGGVIQLDQLVELLMGQQKNDSMTLGYYNAARLLECMLSSSSHSTVETRTMGALDFLADQFESFVVSTVKSAGGGREGIGASLLGYVMVFVEMEVGREKMRYGGVGWRCLYYCKLHSPVLCNILSFDKPLF